MSDVHLQKSFSPDLFMHSRLGEILNLKDTECLFFLSCQQGLQSTNVGERQETLLEAVEVRPLLPGRRRQVGRQSLQLRHHGQLLRGQPSVDGGPRQSDGRPRHRRLDLARSRTRYSEKPHLSAIFKASRDTRNNGH